MISSIRYTDEGDLVFRFSDGEKKVKGKFPLLGTPDNSPGSAPFHIKDLHSGTDDCLWFNRDKIARIDEESMKKVYKKSKYIMRKLKLEALGL